MRAMVCQCSPLRINCLTAKEWLKCQLGVWQFNYGGRDVRDKNVHPGNFPISLARRVIDPVRPSTKDQEIEPDQQTVFLSFQRILPSCQLVSSNLGSQTDCPSVSVAVRLKVTPAFGSTVLKKTSSP